MKRIYKWTLKLTDRQAVDMPRGAEVLCVQMQHGEPQIWAICDPEQPKAARIIRIYGTGHELPADPDRYIGTFQVQGGSLVWHVFEELPA